MIDDDEPIVDLVEVLLGLDGGFRLVGTTHWAAPGIALAEVLEPDVILLDLQLPEMDGIEAIPHLRRVSQAAIVVFSSFPDPYTLISVLKRGADAYVDKANAWAELLPTMRALTSELAT